MTAVKKNYPFVLRLKKGEKPAQMSKERYDEIVARVSKRIEAANQWQKK